MGQMTFPASNTSPVTPAMRGAVDTDLVTVETTRFGTLEIEVGRIMHFPAGLLGFPQASRFALIETGEDSYFFWLQSVDEPQLAFVVCDPQAFVPGYTIDQVPLRSECREELGLSDELAGPALASAAQVLTICNRVGDWLTGNLLGPLVVNVQSFVGKQVVLTEKRWSTRQPLLRLGGDGFESGEFRFEQQPLRKSA